MEKKYILTDEMIEFEGRILNRIKAVKNFGYVKAGNLGGYIESEDNLSHDGLCWVYGDAKVFDRAEVRDNACIWDQACVFEDAYISERASIYDDAEIHGDTWIHGSAMICGRAEIFGDSTVYDHAIIRGNAKIYGSACVYRFSDITGNAQVLGTANICNEAEIFIDAYIQDSRDYLTVGPIGSENRITTFYKDVNGGIRVCTGCFRGKAMEEFINAVISKHGDDHHATKYLAAANLAEMQILHKYERG